MSSEPLGDVAVLTTEIDVADRDLLASLGQAFYRDHADEFDMLVFWASPTLAPGNAFYLPVRNDVAGIGHANVEPGFFDDGHEFGSEALQGIIWMGPDWIENSTATGLDSVLGILAQETAHRWAATIRFSGDELKGASDELLGSPFHWSFLLDTGGTGCQCGASPLGGNAWETLGDGLFRAEPVDVALFSPLDLYLMGLIAFNDVGPIRLLRDARGIEDGSGLFSALGDRVSHPVTVRADMVEISIDQVIDVEGLRDPDSGFTAANIRQAWIIVVDTYGTDLPGGSSASPAITEKLRDLASDWPDEFERMTGGRGSITVATR